MQACWTMAHLTAYAGFTKHKVIGFKPSALSITQLARMADGAVRLVVGSDVELIPIEWIGSFSLLHINQLPVVDPLPCYGAILNRENMNLPVWQGRRIGLLPFGTNGVGNRIRVPTAIRLFDIKKML